MKMSYEKPVIEVRNYSLLQDVSCGISNPDIIDPNAKTFDVKSDDIFK